MSTKIEWPDETSAPATHVVPRDKSPRSAIGVEQVELLLASTCAENGRVRLAKSPQISSVSVFGIVGGSRKDLKILRSVVGLIAIDVVDDFAPPQWPPQTLRDHESVLVDVPAGVGHRMPRNSYQVVAARRERPTTAPLPILFLRIPNAHKFSVARGCV